MNKSIIAFTVLLTAGFAGNALAGQVTCASDGGKYRECRLDGSGDIVMKTQLSKTNCVKNQNWGETPNGVYVKGGCRAIFETMSMNQPQYSGGGGSGYQDLIGSKAAGAETALNSRGYKFVRTTTQGNSKLGFWRKPNNAGCIQVTTSDGRYSAIRDVNTSQCAQSGGSSGYTGNSNSGGSGYKDLVGAKAAGGETSLQSRGYNLAGTSNLPDAKVMYWWKPNRNGCIMVTVREGRYQAISDVDRIECTNAQ